MALHDSLSERNRRLLQEAILPDVTFILGKDRIPAHKGILASSSSVFYLLLTSTPEDESSEILILGNVNPYAFKLLLEFLYTNEAPNIDARNWASLLYVSNKYQLSSLVEKCKAFAERSILTTNVFKLFSQARKHQVAHEVPFLKKLIAYHADKSLSSDTLLEIEDEGTLADILSYDMLNCDEILVYRAAIRWAQSKRDDGLKDESLRGTLGKAFYAIRFPLLSCLDFHNEVIPADILTDEEILCILKKKDSGSFSMRPRVRICERFGEQRVSPLKTADHAIRFKVDVSVKIRGFLINIRHDEMELSGKILLNDENSQMIREKSFEIKYSNLLKSTVVRFEDPIVVQPESVYVASVHFDMNNFTTEMGIDGRSTVLVDGVEWTFENDSSSDETNMSKGQIPAIEFSK